MRRAVIVGGGIAGLGLAVELRHHGLDVAVVEARYPGGGNSGAPAQAAPAYAAPTPQRTPVTGKPSWAQ